MVQEDILGGIRIAVLNGESLKDAMMSFFNSGYKKEDIEEAARAFQTERYQPSSQQPSIGQTISKELVQPKPLISPNQQPQQKPPLTPSIFQKQLVSKPIPAIFQQTTQEVSAYGKPKISRKINFGIVLLIIILILLIASLVGIFLFKDKAIELLDKVLG